MERFLENRGTLVLTRGDVSALLSIEECIAAVEHTFKLHGAGKAQSPGVLGLHAKDGGFHIKAGLLNLDRQYFAAKTNANFPQNVKRYGLPLIQGLIVLCNADNGFPLAVMDSIEITIQRTGAATAVAAKYLARRDSKTVSICGCGNQGRISLKALRNVLPVKKAFAFDCEYKRAETFARELAAYLDIEVEAVADPGNAVRRSDICVTCTPSQVPFLHSDFITPGTFIAAVGADSPEKQELDPMLLKENKVVVDILEQCAEFGELHHALNAQVAQKKNVHAELGEIVAGLKPGRTSSEEIIVFDSTGMALQDVAASVAVFKKAVSLKRGTIVNFA